MKKIMFNDKYHLTEAVLEGRKTQTRRIVPQSVIDVYDEWMSDIECIAKPAGSTIETLHSYLLRKSKFYIGEVIAVAQSYKDIGYCDTEPAIHKELEAGWNNKMFVRVDLMPHQISITNVRVERLQDISDEDCLKEGIAEFNTLSTANGKAYTFDGVNESWRTPREAFARLIDKVSGKGTWESNPYVWVYDFELIKQ